jgi:uncharacterized protein with HEPN domain
MKNDLVYLQHIRDACVLLNGYVVGKTFDDYLKTPLLQDGLVRQLQIVGQASSLLSSGTKSQLKKVEWIAIVGMRNRLVHEYFKVDGRAVWETATVDAPQLLREVQAFLDRD